MIRARDTGPVTVNIAGWRLRMSEQETHLCGSEYVVRSSRKYGTAFVFYCE